MASPHVAGLFALTTKNVVTDARSTNAHLLFSNM